jgi:hypothetical protein
VNSKYRDTSAVDDLRANTLYLLLASIVGGWLIWDAAFYNLVTYAPWADYWGNAALLTEWLEKFLAPANPHVADPSLSSRYTPWFLVLTYFGLIFEFDAFGLMSVSAVVNYLLIVIGLHVFLKSYFRDRWAPLIGFMAVFMFWGISWIGPNFYQLRSFFYIAGDASTFVFGLSLISFSVVLRLLRRDGHEYVMGALLCMLSALMFLCDPLTGVFGIVGCALLALTESSESAGMRLLTLAALLIGTFFAELWPYFSIWKIALGLYGAGAEQWLPASASMGALAQVHAGGLSQQFYNPQLLLTTLGPALLGLPLCIWLFIRRQHMFIVLGAVCMAIPYLLHPFIDMPSAYRFLLFVVSYFHFAIVWGVLQVFDSWTSRPRPRYAGSLLWGVIAVFALLLATNAALLSTEFGGSTYNPEDIERVDNRTDLPQDMNVVDLYVQLTEPLTDEAVVLAMPLVGWPLPSVRGKVVAVYREEPLLVDQQVRNVSAVAFFEKQQNASVRAALVRDYAVSHVLLKGEPLSVELTDWLALHAVPVRAVDEYRMYRLLPSAIESAPPPAAQQNPEDTANDAVDIPSSVAKPVNLAPVETPTDVPAAVQAAAPPASKPATKPSPQLVESVPAKVEDPPAGTYGAPIPEPMIPPVEEVQPLEARSEAVAAQAGQTENVPELTAPSTPVQPAKKSVPEPEPKVYGAPIEEPVLDPERHGG